MNRLVAVVVSCAAMACQNSSSGGLSSVSAMIGPEGGKLVTSDGTRLDVPGGALPAVATLTLQPASGASSPSGATFVSSPWTLEPEWLEFGVPVTFTFPVDLSRLDGGAFVLTSAKSTGGYAAKTTNGYLAVAAIPVDDAHVAAHSTRFATAGAASGSCPASCTAGQDPAGTTLRCTATCVGHEYALSCNGPTSMSSFCTCAVDGVVASTMQVDTRDADAGKAIYTEQCSFPASSWAH